MKKLIVVLIILLTLTGCSTKIDDGNEWGIEYTLKSNGNLVVMQEIDDVNNIMEYTLQYKAENDEKIKYYYDNYSVIYDKQTKEYQVN